MLTGLNVEGMELLIDWAYGKYKRRLGYQQRLSMIRASHRLEVHDLLLECEKALKNSVNSETHPLLADLAREFNCQELEQVGFSASFPVCTLHVHMQALCMYVQKARQTCHQVCCMSH